MRIGFLNGNHTFKTFNNNLEAINWLNQASHEDLHPIEMAFTNDRNLHKELYEKDINWKNRCLSFFGATPMILTKKECNIQDYLIP